MIRPARLAISSDQPFHISAKYSLDAENITHNDPHSHSQAIRNGGPNISMLRTQFTPMSPMSPLVPCWPQPPPRGDTQMGQYLPTPPDTPLEPLPTISPMFSLPNETLDRIFSFIPHNTLPTIMLASSRCHALAERLLYFKVQHILLFSSEDGHCKRDWECIRTLATRPSAAAAVRHFAVQSLPLYTPKEKRLLAGALSAMVNLSSLEFNMDPRAERILVSSKLFISPSLSALNVADGKTALELCRGGRRPISALRISNDSPLDPEAANELLLALGNSSGPVEVLQLAVQCETKAQLLSFLQAVTKFLPHLTTLGLHVRPACLLSGEKDWQVARAGGDILALLPSLRRFSLTGAFHTIHESKEDAENWAQGSQRLELIELQWSGWRRELSGQTHVCKRVPSSHNYLRVRWAYKHAGMN